MTATFQSFMELDARLAAANLYPVTPFWVEQARRLYDHPTADTLVARVGRGGIKSGFGSRVALNEVLCGDFEVPVGEIHYWCDLSENKAEASQRLRQYEAALSALGVAYVPRGDTVIIESLRRGFYVRAFDIGKVSGFRFIGGRADELAKCDADEDAAAPADEVITSWTAAMVTHIRSRPKRLLLSSPMGLDDFHAKRFALGDTDAQIVCHAPTWEANPSITEEETRRLEPDEDKWAREYAAIPSTTEGLAFDQRDVPGCYEHQWEPGDYYLGERYLALDPASKSNTFAVLVFATLEPTGIKRFKRSIPPPESTLSPDIFIGYEVGPDGLPIPVPPRATPLVHVMHVHGWSGQELRALGIKPVVAELASIAQRFGARTIFSDQHLDVALAAMLSEHGLQFKSFSPTNHEIHEAVSYLRLLMREGQLAIERHAGLRSDLEKYPRRVVGGAFKYGAPRAGHHFDFASALVLMAHAMIAEPSRDPAEQSYRIDGAPQPGPVFGRVEVPGS